MMNTNMRRIVAIAFAFALGIMMASKVFAQDVGTRVQESDAARQMEQIERQIAQLQADLARLKSNSQIAPPQQRTLDSTSGTLPSTAPLPGSTLRGSTTRSLSAPGFDPAITGPQLTAPANGTLPAPTSGFNQLNASPQVADSVPSLVEQPAILGATVVPPPTILVPPRPTIITEYCPLTGRPYTTTREYYYRVHPLPPIDYGWDYLDEDRASRYRSFSFDIFDW